MRSAKELLESAHAVIDDAFSKGADSMAPLFSGGHDSLSAVYAASLHPRFDGSVYHINTRIGCRKTREFVEDVCREHGWALVVFESPFSYERFVRTWGFPGPGRHQWVYNRIKERCVRLLMKQFPKQNVALITGCRAQESERRMGAVEPLKIGEVSLREAARRRNNLLFPAPETICNKRRYWTAPCHDWTSADQMAFMDFHDLPRNPIKLSPLGMSGECFCGAFARPNEIELIRKYAPDVADEIDRLTIIAKQCGKHAVWGTRPDGKKGVVVAQTGPLCNSCDARALSSGLLLEICQ